MGTTATVCYKATSTGAVTCGKRKRRRMIVSGGSDHPNMQIQPMDPLAEVESGAEEASSDRDGRFLLYWLTTTSASTTTIYTGTSTLATLDCTPGGYTLNACG